MRRSRVNRGCIIGITTTTKVRGIRFVPARQWWEHFSRKLESHLFVRRNEVGETAGNEDLWLVFLLYSEYKFLATFW